MKGNVPGAGARARGDEGWVVRHEFPVRRVEAKDEDPVNTLIGHSNEPTAWIKHSVVGMRARLLFTIRARLAGQVDQITARPQVSVLLDRHHADRAGAVISGDDPAASRIDRQMPRVLATTGLPVERRDSPVLLVDRICTDLFEVGMHRIEKALRPVERQEGRVDDLEELLVAPGARGRVHSVDVDAATMPFALRGGE